MSLWMTATLVLLSAAAVVPAQEDIEARTANGGRVLLEDVELAPPEVVERLASYQNVRSASFADWASDGHAMWIRTRFGEVMQVHRVDEPLGARRQLTFAPEPVGELARRPRHPSFVFAMDRRGDEFHQLHLFDPTSGATQLLTDGKSRNGSAVWSHDGTRLAFQSTRRNGASNDIWILDPADPQAARVVLEAPGGSWWAPADFSHDRRRLLVAHSVSEADSRIHLLDLASGELEPVAGGDLAPGHFLGITPTFSPDGQTIYLSTDEGGEFRQLARQDVKSGERRLLSESIDWDVEAFALSPDGTQAAFSVNAEGLSRLYLLETATGSSRLVPDLPAGVLSDLSYAPDGSALAFTLDQPTSPGDVYVLKLGGKPRLERWTQSELGGLDSAGFVLPEPIRYPSFDQVGSAARQIPGFVYRPEGEGPFPVLISIHGGPESQARPSFSALYQYWVNELGIAVIVPNVRGSTGYGKSFAELDNILKREDAVRDIGALLDWIQRHSDFDAKRVAVYGESYGGYMALASVMHYSERLAAAVDIVGISNFVTFLENTEDFRRELRRPEYGDERDAETRTFLQRISPSQHAERLRVPLLVAQGANDPRVPRSEAEQVVREVRRNGREVWSFEALNEGHGFRRKENLDLFEQIVVMFLRRHLLPSDEPAND